MNLPYLFLSILAIAPFANAQVHFGVEAGIPLTDTLESSSSSSTSSLITSTDRYNSNTKRLLIGPTIRVDLKGGLGLEFDALYQHVDYEHAITYSIASFSGRSLERTTADRWQFPFMLQYSWKLSKAKLFAQAGPSISHLANVQGTLTSTAAAAQSVVSGPGGTTAGITAGAGVDLPFFRAHLRPEFRYSHWFATNPGTVVGPISGFGFANTANFVTPSFRTTQNEASFLLGLTF